MGKMEKIGIGGTAILATIGAGELPIADILQVITQIVIAVGTLISMFKKNKNGKD